MSIFNPPDMYGIQRICTKTQATGWRVAISRDGKFVAWRIFSDRGYGDEQASLGAARAYRDEMLKQHPPIQMSEFRTRLRKHNTSGYPGVALQKQAGKPRAFLASTKVRSGESLTRSFSIARYGWDVAFRLAVEARQQQLQRVTDAPVCSPSAVVAYEQSENKENIDKERVTRYRRNKLTADLLK